jgi:hypothetical protein
MIATGKNPTDYSMATKTYSLFPRFGGDCLYSYLGIEETGGHGYQPITPNNFPRLMLTN